MQQILTLVVVMSIQDPVGVSGQSPHEQHATWIGKVQFALSMLQVVAVSPAVLVSLGFVTLIGGLLVYLFVIRPALSPLRVIPGPKPSHWIFGSLGEIINTKWSDGKFPEPHLSWCVRC
ncbi:unnamed protein product [Aphanomyces euteiches]